METIQIGYPPSKSDRELIERIKRGEIIPRPRLVTREEHAEIHGFNQTARPRRRNKRPSVLPEPKPYYAHGDKYPDSVRICFEDGHTEIYDRRISQPSPGEYVNHPQRRRRKE